MKIIKDLGKGNNWREARSLIQTLLITINECISNLVIVAQDSNILYI